MEYAIEGKSLNGEFSEWFQDLGVSEHVKGVLKSIHSSAKLLDGAGTPASGMTSDWHRDSRTEGDDPAEDDVLTEVHGALKEAICQSEVALLQEAELLHSPKFEDEETKA